MCVSMCARILMPVFTHQEQIALASPLCGGEEGGGDRRKKREEELERERGLGDRLVKVRVEQAKRNK